MTPADWLAARTNRARYWKRRLPWIVGIGTLLVIIFLPGYARWHELNERKQRLQREIVELERANRETRLTIERLQRDPDYIEQVAREKLGVVRPGEVILQLAPPSPDTIPTDDPSTIDTRLRARRLAEEDSAHASRQNPTAHQAFVNVMQAVQEGDRREALAAQRAEALAVVQRYFQVETTQRAVRQELERLVDGVAPLSFAL